MIGTNPCKGLDLAPALKQFNEHVAWSHVAFAVDHGAWMKTPWIGEGARSHRDGRSAPKAKYNPIVIIVHVTQAFQDRAETQAA